VDNVAAVELACGQARRCVKAARIIYENGLPIDAAAALNEGFQTGFRS
jgi:hypothetical protein